jgi:hypothetical protein
MHVAHEQSLLIDGLLITIVVAYLGIAYQFWTRRRSATGRATTALGQLVIIFVFCALCGYLPRLVELPQGVLLVAHTVLAAAAWAYMLSGQVDRLSIAVDFADSQGSRQQRTDELLAAEAEACARVAEQAGARIAARQIRERHAPKADTLPNAVAEGA